MGECDLRSLILACDFRIAESLASIGAHHVLPYTSIWSPQSHVGNFADPMSIGERV
jgi:hypothetical protein